MSVAISFNSIGKVDTVYLSKKIAPELLSILKSPVSLSRKMTETIPVFNEYKNKIVMFPILFINLDDQILDYKSGFLKNIEGIWPDLNGVNEKSVIILETYVNRFFRRI